MTAICGTCDAEPYVAADTPVFVMLITPEDESCVIPVPPNNAAFAALSARAVVAFFSVCTHGVLVT